MAGIRVELVGFKGLDAQAARERRKISWRKAFPGLWALEAAVLALAAEDVP